MEKYKNKVGIKIKNLNNNIDICTSFYESKISTNVFIRRNDGRIMMIGKLISVHPFSLYEYDNDEVIVTIATNMEEKELSMYSAIFLRSKEIPSMGNQEKNFLYLFPNQTTCKRNDYISWNKCFMDIAKVVSQRSKDPNTQVGSCIVKDNKILSLGYNGFPNGCSDDEFPWCKDSDKESLENKYLYVVHSELNAILNYDGHSLKGSTIYVTLFPCNECAKAIIQSGIKKVVFLEYRDSISNLASKRMFESANIEIEKYTE